MALAILATGDEIIHGDTLNTNGHEIAKILSSEGVPLGMQLACSDKEQDLLDSIAFLVEHHNIIVSIGGLGPTSDDRTRFAFARFLGLELIEFPEALLHIQSRLKRANFPFDEGNKLQALFPEIATLLPNPNGTAMGCMFSAQDKLFVLLPGPPRECLPMFNDYVLPRLQNTQHSQKRLLLWQLFGVSEGHVAGILEKALEGVACHTGYRLDTPYLEFKVRCAADVVETVKKCIDPLAQPFVISPPKIKASQLLRERLANMTDSVAIVDRATGGLLETLVRRPENSQVVTFFENASANYHFEISGLNAFWMSDHIATAAELVIQYRILQHAGRETHSIPFRGHALILNYAAEWLSFRLLHLIDEVHQGKG